MKTRIIIPTIVAIAAITLTVGTSAFKDQTPRKARPINLVAPEYYVYTSGTERDASHYTIQSSAPVGCSGSTKICYVEVEDMNGDNVVNSADFLERFDDLDVNSNGLISDESTSLGYVKKN